jgi:hypothetical protein
MKNNYKLRQMRLILMSKSITGNRLKNVNGGKNFYIEKLFLRIVVDIFG